MERISEYLINSLCFDVKNLTVITQKEQKANEIELQVEHVERTFGESQAMDSLRNNVSSSILSLQSTLGQFSSDMNTIMSDNKLFDDEKTQISSYSSSLSSGLNSVTSQIDSVISHFQEQGDSEKVTRLTTAKNNFQYCRVIWIFFTIFVRGI